MMNWNDLLRWVSEAGEGTWAELREAHAWLASRPGGSASYSPGFGANVLSMLGHSEIDWRAGRWAVAPPVVTMLPSAGGHGLLAGARTKPLVDALFGTDHGGDIFLAPYLQPLGPDALFVACADEAALAGFAQELGIGYEYSVSDRLAELLPPLDKYLSISGSTPPARGFGIEKLHAAPLRFYESEDDDSPGLYRYRPFGRPEYRFFDGERFFALDLALGCYAELRRDARTSVLAYRRDSVNGVLVVPRGAPLPTLHARCAVMCSGLVPLADGGTLKFLNVPERTARRIADALSQALEITD